jgi:ABC-2 type transport system ATP-binding protein
MIEVESLTKNFGAITAVDNLTFRVERGEILGFLGPNGAGKTTTMRILTGYMPATRGTARVAGFDVATDSLDVRRNVGYLPESVPIYPERSVTDYLSFVADMKGLPRRGKTAALSRVIEQCGLADHRQRIVGRLSRGYRQRVGLAQALVNDPRVLVLDEPTVGLDPAQVVEVRQLIRSLAGDRTVILSTHILPEVSQICSRVMIIDRGKIAAQGTPDELTARLRSTQGYRIRIKGDQGMAERILASVPGVERAAVVESDGQGSTFRVEALPEADIRGAMARALVEAGLELLEMSAVAMTLEEIFISLVRHDRGEGNDPPGRTAS